jgi:hypothetical protein
MQLSQIKLSLSKPKQSKKQTSEKTNKTMPENILFILRFIYFSAKITGKYLGKALIQHLIIKCRQPKHPAMQKETHVLLVYQPASVTLDCTSASFMPFKKKQELISACGDSRSKKCKRGYCGTYGGVRWSLESGGRFCAGEFGRNLASVAVKMFSRLIQFIKKCYNFQRDLQRCRCNKEGSFPSTLKGHSYCWLAHENKRYNMHCPVRIQDESVQCVRLLMKYYA